MAVQNYKTNYDADPTVDAALGAFGHGGTTPKRAQATVTHLASDNDGSSYLLYKNVPADAVLHDHEIENAAITLGTSYKIGVFNPITGAAISDACFASGLDMSAAATKNAPKDGLSALSHEQTSKPIFEIAGHTAANKLPTYDIVLTGVTAGTALGKITSRAVFCFPG